MIHKNVLMDSRLKKILRERDDKSYKKAAKESRNIHMQISKTLQENKTGICILTLPEETSLLWDERQIRFLFWRLFWFMKNP